MENNESLPVVEKAIAIIDPVVTPEEAKASWKRYQEIKKAIAEPSDIQNIAGKDFLKKSYWRKLKTYFNIDVKFLDEKEEAMLVLIRTNKVQRKNKKTGEYFEAEEKEIEYYPLNTEINILQENEIIKTTVVFSAYYRAIAPIGRFMDGDGHCDTWEKGYPNSYHNAKSTAHTRAKNRAISDLVGGGEVSAEEIEGEYKSSSKGESKSTTKKIFTGKKVPDNYWKARKTDKDEAKEILEAIGGPGAGYAKNPQTKQWEVTKIETQEKNKSGQLKCTRIGTEVNIDYCNQSCKHRDGCKDLEEFEKNIPENDIPL